LNIDVGDDEIVGRESETIANLLVLVGAKDGLTDDLRAVLVEVIEGDGGNRSTHARSNGLARISDKVGNLEDLRCLVLSLLHLEVPVVRKLQRQPCVVRRFHDDDIGHEIGTELQCQGFDDVRSFGFVTR